MKVVILGAGTYGQAYASYLKEEREVESLDSLTTIWKNVANSWQASPVSDRYQCWRT